MQRQGQLSLYQLEHPADTCINKGSIATPAYSTATITKIGSDAELSGPCDGPRSIPLTSIVDVAPYRVPHPLIRTGLSHRGKNLHAGSPLARPLKTIGKFQHNYYSVEVNCCRSSVDKGGDQSVRYAFGPNPVVRGWDKQRG